ncbi:MAG: GyrI-like domain-containing protein [Armatimonadetes bacterium]|nr:GyrI-like domain-containing protein [Armatimonadota bacterium]
MVQVQIIDRPPQPVIMLRHTGSYDDIGPVFEQLWGWAASHGMTPQKMIGVYWDNPDYTPVDKLRSAACIEVPFDYKIMDSGGLALTQESLAGGAYATTRYVGRYENLASVWTEFTATIEHKLNRAIRENDPAFEAYLNDASETPPEKLITELFMPLV